MNDTRWMDVPVPSPTEPWPEPPEGARVRITHSADRQTIERLEFEVPRLPQEPGWYRYPKEFGVVFLREDGSWLAANGARIDTDQIPDGLIRLRDEAFQ